MKMAGPSAPSSTRIKKKMNPARATSSKLRLEQFIAKKEDEKLKRQQTGSQTSAGGKLILDLAKEEQVIPEGTGLLRTRPSTNSLHNRRQISKDRGDL